MYSILALELVTRYFALKSQVPSKSHPSIPSVSTPLRRGSDSSATLRIITGSIAFYLSNSFSLPLLEGLINPHTLNPHTALRTSGFGS